MFLDFWVSWVFMGIYRGLWVSGYLWVAGVSMGIIFKH